MLRAALTSRWWTVPHRHVHVRTFSGIRSASAPQVEHRLDDGNQRSTTIRLRPRQSALYSRMVLDYDPLVVRNEPSGQLVQVVGSTVGDPGVDSGDLEPGLGPVRGAFLFL